MTFQPVSAHNLPSMQEAFHVLLSLEVKSPAGKRDRKARDVLSFPSVNNSRKLFGTSRGKNL